jgi:hypothetical protein
MVAAKRPDGAVAATVGLDDAGVLIEAADD